MSTKQTAKISIDNNSDSAAEIWIAHRSDDPTVTLQLIKPPAADGIDRFQYPQSTAYHVASVGIGQTMTFALEYAAGPGAGMDYWYAAVRLTGGRKPGSYSCGGSTLLPMAQMKIPDSGQSSLSIYSDPHLLEPYFAMGGVSSVWMNTDAVFDPYPTVRKSVASLTVDERSAYVIAVKGLKSSPSRLQPPTRSRYDDYVLVHMLAMNQISVLDPSKPIDNDNITINDPRTPMWAHQSPAFVPWHRVFLRQFERDLRATTPDRGMAIPYWDWSVNSDPQGPPWSSDFMGGDGQDGPVTTGPFAGKDQFGKDQWRLTLSGDRKESLIRGFGRCEGYGRLPLPLEVDKTLNAQHYDAFGWNGSSSLDSFRNRLEGFCITGLQEPPTLVGMHNLVHVWVGGNNGTMLPGSSPNDPIFFLHHCNIDRLWWVWQLLQTDDLHPGKSLTPLYEPIDPINVPGQSLDQEMIFMDPAVSSKAPWPPATPADVLSHHALNYMFDREVPGYVAPPVLNVR